MINNKDTVIKKIIKKHTGLLIKDIDKISIVHFKNKTNVIIHYKHLGENIQSMLIFSRNDKFDKNKKEKKYTLIKINK